jgi:ankyrin repeat protein
METEKERKELEKRVEKEAKLQQKAIEREEKQKQKDVDKINKAAEKQSRRQKKAERDNMAKFYNRLDMTSEAMRATPEDLAEHLKHRADLIEDIDRGGHTPLICACAFAKPDNVRVLINSGANLKTADKNGETALIQAAQRGTDANVDIVGQLVDAGAEIDIQNKKGKTALHYSCGADEGLSIDLYSLKMVQRLVESGASLNRKDTVAHRTALMWADNKGLSTIAAYLRGKEKEKELEIVGASVNANINGVGAPDEEAITASRAADSTDSSAAATA